MSDTNNKPVETLRDGAIKATIWRNESENGPFYGVTYSRTYTDGNGNPNDTDSFSGGAVLKQARLAHKAYDRMVELRKADAEVAAAGQQAA